MKLNTSIRSIFWVREMCITHCYTVSQKLTEKEENLNSDMVLFGWHKSVYLVKKIKMNVDGVLFSVDQDGQSVKSLKCNGTVVLTPKYKTKNERNVREIRYRNIGL